ncbi:MAG TPA: LLM class flavin-dependent oxidoreductase [Actinomycetota bacterium]|nr:LLM class flavin-dependent oxidoreductase [Actinomycetota bacterium]
MSTRCRVGVQLPEVERDVRWPEYLAMARAAEESGFDSIWVGDHYLYRGDGRPERGPWEAWTLLAGLAAATERVRLGPLVACLAFHDPAVLAKMASTVDEISGGRLVVGVGAGWNRTEFEAFGIPFDHRASRFEESFGILRRLLAGERVTSEGRWHRTVDAVLLPPPARRPELMVGSTGPRVLAVTLPHVDVWNTWYDWFGNTPEGFSARRREIDRACEEAGRDPATVARSACVLVRLPGAGERPVDGDAVPLAGSPAAIDAGVRAFADAGADEVILVCDPITESTIRELGSIVGTAAHP